MIFLPVAGAQFKNPRLSNPRRADVPPGVKTHAQTLRFSALWFPGPLGKKSDEETVEIPRDKFFLRYAPLLLYVAVAYAILNNIPAIKSAWETVSSKFSPPREVILKSGER